MSEALPSVDEAFADALRALEEAGDSAVAIGGWAVRLLREHALAQEQPHQPLFTTDLDVALAKEDHALGDRLHERLESMRFVRLLEGDEKPPVSSHVRETAEGPVKVEFLMTRIGAPVSKSGKSKRTCVIGGLTAQCFPTVRLLLLEPWKVSVRLGRGVEDGERDLEVRVPNPAALIFEKLLIIEKRKNTQGQAKDLLYMAELISMFADAMGHLRELADGVVTPALHASEKKRIRNRIEKFVATNEIVLAAAAEAGSTGRRQWAEPVVLADLLQAGIGGLVDP